MTRQRLAARRKKARLFALLAGVFIFVLIFIGLIWGSYHPALNINKVEVNGLKMLQERTIKTFIDAQLSDGELHLFSLYNELLLPRRKLANNLQSNFPRIKNVEIPFSILTQKLQVTIVERTPTYIWCADVASTACYNVDELGYIFAKRVAGEQTQKNLQVIHSKIDSEKPLREHVLKGELFTQLLLIFNNVSKVSGLFVKSVDIVDTDAMVEFKGGWFVKMDLKGDVQAQLGNLKTLLDSREIKESIDVLEYIDLRFNNRVYYKLYEEE